MARRQPVEEARWYGIRLQMWNDESCNPAEVASFVSLSAITVRRVLHRWNAFAADGLAHRRKANGANPLPDACLLVAVKKRPPTEA